MVNTARLIRELKNAGFKVGKSSVHSWQNKALRLDVIIGIAGMSLKHQKILHVREEFLLMVIFY